MRQSPAARQIRSRAVLAWAVAPARQQVRAEPATPSPAIRGARDAQRVTPAEPAHAYPACTVSRSMEPTGWAAQIELIRHSDLIAGCVGTRAHADDRAQRAGMFVH